MRNIKRHKLISILHVVQEKNFWVRYWALVALWTELRFKLNTTHCSSITKSSTIFYDNDTNARKSFVMLLCLDS